MRLKAVIVSLVLGAAGCLPPAGAQTPAEAHRGELSELRDKIRSLQDALSRSEQSHHVAADALASSDKAISGAQRKLRELAGERGNVEAELARLAEEQRVIERTLAGQRKALGDTLYRVYVEGGQGGARRFLSGDNPNQISRDAYYLEQIARQRMKAVEAARASMAQLEQLRADAGSRQAALLDLERSHAAEQQKLESARSEQQEALNRISVQIKGQREAMQTLQQDEARMTKLIQGLERIARQQAEARAREQARLKAEAQAAAARSAAAASAHASSASRGERVKEEPPSGKAVTLAREEPAGVDFAARRGKLGWPVRGDLRGRFGAPRAGGGTNWHGIFIKAENGADVHAVAGGRVVFADWLRGFGNVVIVDHGDGYMSVYGNNESLLRNTGDTVRAGETLATVGRSGGQDESGLYFEIRYRGQAQDPAKWMAAR